MDWVGFIAWIGQFGVCWLVWCGASLKCVCWFILRGDVCGMGYQRMGCACMDWVIYLAHRLSASCNKMHDFWFFAVMIAT